MRIDFFPLIICFYENLKISEEQLKELQEATMAVAYKPNYVYISLVMKFKKK